MRVIAGEFRSRVLKSVPGLQVRPTPDRLRESLFNVLAPRIGGCVFLDAYAGSGAVGIEAVSRGAKHAILIERDARALAVIRENVAALGLHDRVTILRGRALTLLPTQTVDLVFIDPPYDLVNEYTGSLQIVAEGSASEAMAQHTVRLRLPEHFGGLRRSREIRQGDNMLSFYGRGGSMLNEQA